MSIYTGLKAAKETGIDRSFAINARRRYLTGRLMAIDDEIYETARFHDPAVPLNDLAIHILTESIVAAMEERESAQKELEAIKGMTSDPKNRITDDMIEIAKQHPVEGLIDFRHKKASAWCHEDKRPSLCHMTRKNLAWCPVCNKYFDPIKIRMDRDGMTFKDAVLSLI